MRSIDKLALASAIFGGVALISVSLVVLSMFLFPYGSNAEVELIRVAPWLDTALDLAPLMSLIVALVALILGLVALNMPGVRSGERREQILARFGIGLGATSILVFPLGLLLYVLSGVNQGS